MIDSLLKTVASRCPLTERDVGSFQTLKANGMTFSVRAFDAAGFGRVSVMTAKGFFGLMQMDTLILNPLSVDLPLYSYDRVKALGNDTLIIELYDTLLNPVPLESVAAVNGAYADLREHPLGEHWYDAIKLPQSVSKKGKKPETPRFDRLTEQHLAAYLDSAPDAPCDPGQKREKASVYVEGLLSHGGPSTDVFLKTLGRDRTETLFREILFGTK